MENSNRQLNNEEEVDRNNSPEEALLKTEEKIKNLAFKDAPASEGFRQDLKAKIIAARRHSSMKFFTVKFMVPAVAFAFVLAFATGAIYFKYTGSSGAIAKLGQEKIASVFGTITGHRQVEEVAVLDSAQAPEADLNGVQAPSAASSFSAKMAEIGSPTGGAANNQAISFSLVKSAFAESPAVQAEVKPSLKGEKAVVANLSNYKNFEIKNGKFSSSAKQALEENNFFLAENKITAAQDQFGQTDDFVDIYKNLKGGNSIYDREPQNSVFISSDVGLHLYHILIDRSFQKIEETKLQPALAEMTRALFEDSMNNYNQATDPILKDSYKRLAVYYLVPLVVLDVGNNSVASELKPEDYPSYAEFLDAQTKQQEELAKGDLKFFLNDINYDGFELSVEVYDLAKKELALIAGAKGMAVSPLFTPLRPDFLNDYTQFTPRSHYTKNNILKSYFIAMMWYGRMGFPLKSPELTRDALLITGQVNSLQLSDGSLAKKWADIMAVIDFFVGETDDLTPYQFTSEMKKIYGDGVTSEIVIQEENLQKFIAGAVADLPSPRVLSEIINVTGRNASKEELLKETLQFRFMGQRFTPDAYVLNKLTQGDEAADPETGQKLPSMATALEPISILSPDNQVVKNYLNQWVAESAPNSDKVIAKVYNQLKDEFAKYDPGVWTQNIYWSWLNSFRSLLGDYGQGYPFFMKNDSWKKKNLGTALGSYTELKHDTLLYLKQSYAEFGAGGGEEKIPPVPKGYVEPDLVFWNKLASLAQRTVNGLKNRNMFPEEFDNKYQVFIDDVNFFQKMAAAELQNKKISDDDFEKLRLMPNSLERISEALPGEELTTKEKRAGIVADIHTDGKTSRILYEATGKPNLIYTAIKDINGTRLTVGAVYNHYEFITPLEKRLADEDWQAKVYGGIGALPAGDKWTMEIKK